MLLAEIAHPRLQRYLEGAWGDLTAFVNRHGGGGLTHDLMPGITGLQFCFAAAMLLGVLVIMVIVHAVSRRKIKREAAKESGARPSWVRLILEQGRRPFFFALWVAGIYAIAWALIFREDSLGPLLLGIDWAERAFLIVALFWFLYRMVNVVEIELRHWALLSRSHWSEVLAAMLVRGLRGLTPLVAILLLIPTLSLPRRYDALAQELASLILIGGVGLILIEMAATAERAVSREFSANVTDNLAMRKVQTQVGMLRKIAVTLIGTITLACMLMVFPSIRHVGTSMLASAGLAGIVLGFAAQKSLSNLIAGIQIAFTQPIRIDDVVVLENEWGRVEEINLTYVVVRIWDLRRLVVPITYFVEKPFTNWTRTGSEILEAVFLYLDYTVPLAALRAEFDRILEQSPRWDKKVKALQITNIKESTIEVRALLSAADSGAAFDLCCEVREKLIDFLQREHPGALPKTRAEIRTQGS